MPFDDDDFGLIFPTRFGKATGTANERQMLDNVGGSSESFRHKVRDDGDGTVTRMKTHDGMPRFITEEEDRSTVFHDEIKAYLESGQLEFQYPGEANPTRSKPAKWKLHDISSSDNWIGEVYTRVSGSHAVGEKTAPQPTPVETGVLVDNVDSIAIGFKESIDPYVNAQREAANEVQVIAKKLVCSYFPASHFSGKMRAFIQAQYGAAIPTKGFCYSVSIVGEAASLYYTRSDKPDLPTIQFGFFSHFTTGMYCASDYNYYIVQLTEASGSSLMTVTVLPVTLGPAGKAFKRAIAKGLVTGSENLRKAEFYMFADAVIETDKSFSAGTFAPGGCGDSPGYTLAWGWKFNQQGSEASIIRVGTVGESGANTLDGRAKEIHISIARTSVFDGSESGKWTISGTASEEKHWLDGWGRFNIFAPESQFGTSLILYSMAATRGTVAAYDFSEVPVYGFYDKHDVWKKVELSRTVSGADFNKYEQEQSGLVLGSVFLNSYDAEAYRNTGDTNKDFDNDANAQKRWYETASYEKRYNSGEHSVFDLDVGGTVFNGWVKTGSYRRSEWDAGEDIDLTVSVGGQPGYTDGVNIGLPPPQWYVDITDYVDSFGGLWGAFAQWGGDNEYFRTDNQRKTQSNIRSAGTFDYHQRWSLVIPVGDCCVAHVATNLYKSRTETSRWWYGWTVPIPTSTQMKRVTKPGHYEIVTFSTPDGYNTLSRWNASSSVLDNAVITVSDEASIRGWSLSLSGGAGTPSGSYYSLFVVSTEDPVFNGSISYRESAGGKYKGSEGFDSGGVGSGLFVGWY